MDAKLLQRFEDAVRHDGRYPPEAFDFLQQGLERATRSRYTEVADDEPRHVTGGELCLALRDLARERWGPLAHLVLEHWNIRRTRDFGEMVYLMITIELMGRQDSDRIEDFDNVYDFASAFAEYAFDDSHWDF